ncbi:MAG: hypothetical protein KME04_13385 [Pleurocapsa minor GSE-CHR-MK-17-07R]|jgi:hypothetical protein|nr:hypothetical protein [Pleurocapsa minor GSE-CHR-MK 17-07R]
MVLGIIAAAFLFVPGLSFGGAPAVMARQVVPEVCFIRLLTGTQTVYENNIRALDFGIIFSNAPAAVSVTIVSSDPSEGVGDPDTVANVVQGLVTGTLVSMVPVDDDIDDGDQTYTLTLDFTDGSLCDTIDVTGRSLTFITVDDDTAGVTITQSGGSTDVSEAGDTDTYSVVLTSEPVADVTVNLNGGSQLSVVPASLTFTPNNWDTPQDVTVGAVNDAVAEGAHTGTISHTISSSDSVYAGLTVASVTATIADDDSAGVLITPQQITKDENGAAQTYSISLSSAPSGSVSFTLTFDDSQISVNGSASPVTLTFTDAAPQVITVQALDNALLNSSRITLIAHAITTSSAIEYPTTRSLPSVEVGIVELTALPTPLPPPPPPPTPLCETHNFEDGGVVRSSVADADGQAINCRVMFQNGAPTSWLGSPMYGEANLGVPGLVELGVQQAIDIFSPGGLSYFNGGAVFCLRGQGTLIWLAASGVPRHPEIIGSYTVPDFPGFTCATLFEPGTLVLVSRNPLG